MATQFPGSFDSFTDKIDNVDVIRAVDINTIQDCIVGIERAVTSVVTDDVDLMTLCHFEGKTDGYRGLSANGTGAIRYFSGKYGEGVFVEHGTTNYVKNPAVRASADLWSAVVDTGTASMTRITSDYPVGIDTTGALQVNVDTAGTVGVTLKTTMTGLAASTAYTISFWVKNVVTGGNFSGSGMKIAYSDGSGASGPSFSVGTSWTRVSGTYTTASGQDSFVLEIVAGKSGAALNDKILFCGFQVEGGSLCSTYCDGEQGTGYIWTSTEDASSSVRSAAVVQYPVTSSSNTYLGQDKGTIGFWFSPDWGNSDATERYLFDTGSNPSGKQISIFKGTDNKLNFKILEPSSTYVSAVTSSAVDWEPASGWLSIACTYSYNSGTTTWTLHVYVNGAEATVTTAGTASTSGALGGYMYLGSSCSGDKHADGTFDEFFTYTEPMTEVRTSKIYDSSIPMSEGKINATLGSDTTDSTAGTAKAIAHGLGEIPSFIEITEKGAAIVYLSDANTTTNTNFYVKSTGSSTQFDWRAWK